jgi:hypothetical protein
MTTGGSSKGHWPVSGPGRSSPAQFARPLFTRARSASEIQRTQQPPLESRSRAPSTGTTSPIMPPAAPTGCARCAPGQDTCEHAFAGQGVHSNPLPSRERRFESCRGHWSEAQIRTLDNLDTTWPRACDLRRRGGVPDPAPDPRPAAGPQPRKAPAHRQTVTTAARPLPRARPLLFRPYPQRQPGSAGAARARLSSPPDRLWVPPGRPLTPGHSAPHSLAA